MPPPPLTAGSEILREREAPPRGKIKREGSRLRCLVCWKGLLGFDFLPSWLSVVLRRAAGAVLADLSEKILFRFSR